MGLGGIHHVPSDEMLDQLRTKKNSTGLSMEAAQWANGNTFVEQKKPHEYSWQSQPTGFFEETGWMKAETWNPL